MEKNNIKMGKSWNLEESKTKYRSATTRTSLDSKKLKKKSYPDIYEEYSKTSEVASSISN